MIRSILTRPAGQVGGVIVVLVALLAICAPFLAPYNPLAVRLGQFPHQFSGGMRQRVLIAMAVACRPRLLIADEPTTALDVTVQAQIVALLHDMRQRLGFGLLFITHNLDLMAQICSRAMVLYGGTLMEDGQVATLFAAPRQPYTRALIDCVPRLTDRPGDLRPIQGASPVPGQLGPGCRFFAQPARIVRRPAPALWR